MIDDTTETFLYQNEKDNCYLKFAELSHTLVPLTKVPYSVHFYMCQTSECINIL